MGTRATYRFRDDKRGFEVYYYIHLNNFPEGAATHLQEMHNSKSNGGAAEKFIRANTDAEYTRNHESHWDTEYRYNIDGNGNLKAYECIDLPKAKFKVFFKGHYLDFIKKHLHEQN